MFKIIKINDIVLSESKYEIYKDNKFYVGNITKKGLKYWKNKIFK